MRDRMTTAWRTLAVAAIAVFMVSLDSTVLFVAFPSIRATFSEVSSEGISWILNVYTLGYGALLVPTGRLADRFGRRRFFLAGIAVFTLASLLCGVAPNVPLLIAARGMQSVGAALLMPASLALVLHAFPTERRGVAIGIWGAVGALAAAIGPAAGSAIVQFATWRWVFLLNLPLGAYALLIGRQRVRESQASEQGGLPDAIGIVLLVASFGVMAYGIIGAREKPSIAPAAVLLGLALLALFVLRSLRVAVPALDVRLFRRRTFAIANAMTLVFGIAFTAMFFGNVLFLTERWHLSIFEAGVWISPGPLTVIPVAILAGRRADRTGYRRPFVAGGLLFAMSAAWMLHVANGGASFLLWLPPSIAAGSAVGFVLPSLSGAAALDLDAATFGAGSGVNQAIRQFGSVLGVAVVVLLVGRPGETPPFERVFAFLLIGGLLTTIGGLAMPAPPVRLEAEGGAP